MSRFPAVECDSPDYVRLIPVIYATLVGVVAGIPAIIIALLLYMYFTGRLGMDPNFTRRFGTLYENYRHAPEMKALLWVSHIMPCHVYNGRCRSSLLHVVLVL